MMQDNCKIGQKGFGFIPVKIKLEVSPQKCFDR